MYSLCIPDTFWGSEGVSLCQYFLSYIHIIIPFLLYAIKCISLSVLWLILLSVLWLILLSVLWYNLHNTFFPWNIGVYYIQASLSFVSCFWYYLLCGYRVLWPNPLQMFYWGAKSNLLYILRNIIKNMLKCYILFSFSC
jgi:hypothetical protein